MQEPLNFIDNEQWIAAAVGLAKDLMAAPATFVWASAGGDEVNRTFAVSVAPGFYVAADVDGMTSRPRDSSWRKISRISSRESGSRVS